MRKEIINRQMEAKNLREDLEAASRQYATDKKEFEELEDKLDRLKVLGRVPSSCRFLCFLCFPFFLHLSVCLVIGCFCHSVIYLSGHFIQSVRCSFYCLKPSISELSSRSVSLSVSQLTSHSVSQG